MNENVEQAPEIAQETLKPRRQFQPGQGVKDSYGRLYRVDQNGSLRRLDDGKLGKAEKKAAKRQRRAGRRRSTV